MKKCVIYSTCVGNYDNLKSPKVVDSHFDYILFTDQSDGSACRQAEPTLGPWNLRPLPCHFDNSTKTARWIKCHPEILLPEYETSVWMDSNIQIIHSDAYTLIDNLIEDKIAIGTLPHPYRNCIYDEAAVVMKNQLDSEYNVRRWLHQLLHNHYPPHNGLSETGIVFRRHHNTQIKTMNQLWWNYIDHYSIRDQLSFNYVVWQLGITYQPIIDRDIRHDYRFSLTPHRIKRNEVKESKESFHPFSPEKRYPSRLYRYLLNRPSEQQQLWHTYLQACRLPTSKIAIAVAGQWWRWRHWKMRHSLSV